MGLELGDQGTGCTTLFPFRHGCKSVIQVTLSSCTRLEEKLARMLDMGKECSI